MQYLVVFRKKDRKLIASFKLNTIITEMDCLIIPDMSYLITTRSDIYDIDKNGQYYIKENLEMRKELI